MGPRPVRGMGLDVGSEGHPGPTLEEPVPIPVSRSRSQDILKGVKSRPQVSDREEPGLSIFPGHPATSNRREPEYSRLRGGGQLAEENRP